MAGLIKTTITVPEDVLRMAKLTALQENTTLSNLIREALEKRIYLRKTTRRRNPMRLAGILNRGITKIYNKRSDLYEKHLQRKMGF